MVRKQLLVVLLVVASGIYALQLFSTEAKPQARVQKAGAAAPEFSLSAYEGGGTVSLSQYRGKVVLLYFWFPT